MKVSFYGICFLIKGLCKLRMVFAVVSLFSLSCTNNLAKNGKEQRFKHNFQQGTADNLYNISELLGKDPVLDSEEQILLPLPKKDSFKKGSKFPPLSSVGGYPRNISKKGRVSGLLKIRTVAKGEKAIVSFAQDNIHIDPKISFINEYEFLDYEIQNAQKTEWHKYMARLLGKVRFKGFPETNYYILPLFVSNYLVLYKLGPPDKIPYDELPLAKSVGRMLAVPLVGYPIQYCVPEVVPDINDRETGQYRPKCEGIQMKYAEYVYLEEGNKKVFQYKAKPDLFPRNFFNLTESEGKKDKWFYVRTVVKSPKNTKVGHQLFLPSNLVEFHPASRKLDVLDASGYVKSEDKLRALFIPVEWVDYQIKGDSEILHPSFSEEEKRDIHNKDLRYFKIRFEDLVENEIEFVWEKTLKDVVITDNYFSFNVEITNKETGAYLVKFAFFKKPNGESTDYTPKQWFEEDSTLFFPTFAEKRRYYRKALDYSEADSDRFLRTTRFNPKAKEIKWYFSKQTPNDSENKWVRELGQLAVDLLNLALKEAGKDSDHKMKVVLDKSEAKEVGDIRYNILNLIVSEGKSEIGLLGLGPNVANPITGEVLSATANVWVSHVLSDYIAIVRRYIRFQVYPPAWKMKPFSRKVTNDLQEWVNEKTPECGDLSLQPLSITTFMYEKINSICPEVSEFIKRQKENKVTYDPENPDLDDNEEIKSCAKKLAFLPILGTTLHEILHGFAQRHVFSASVDKENFYKNHNEIKKIFGNIVSSKMKNLFGDFPFVEGTKCHPQPPQYSSVMDYMDLYNPMLFVPGKLDIAALRFIYFDKVDLKGGGFLKVPSGADKDPKNPQKSILEAADAEGYKRGDLKNYKVLCGGEKIDDSYTRETNPNQPLCKVFDYGANPLEVVINSILKTNSYLMGERNRYDTENIKSSTFKENFNFKSQAGDLYEKWKQYRDELLRQYSKSIDDYSFLNPEHIEKYKDIMEKEQAKSSEFKMYYEIRRPVFDYFKRLIFMPVKHCIYKKRRNEGEKFQYSAIALEHIMAEEKGDYIKYPENSRERFISCKSPVVEAWAKEKGELVTEVGFFGDDLEYFLRKKGEDPNDEISAFKIWDKITEDDNPFFDIVMEPEFGNEYYQEVQAYMLEGMNLNPYIDDKLIKEDPNIPRDNSNQIHLNRILSYRIDERASENLSGIAGAEGIFRRRWHILETAINKLKRTNAELKLQFDLKLRDLVDIGRTAEATEHDDSDYPFFAQVYEEYKKQKEQNDGWWDYIREYAPIEMNGEHDSFASFIRDHPATLHNRADGPFIIVPYVDAEENFPAQLFRRFNEFWDCIENENEKEMVCDDKEEKDVYIKYILKHYYTENPKTPDRNSMRSRLGTKRR